MPCETVADPFLLVREGTWYLFFEAMNKDTRRGEIGYATSQDGLAWSYQGIVLRESFHLSYPHIFEAAGAIYMIPETRQAGAIRLYIAEEFPTRWRFVTTLQQGPYADASIFFHEGRWWIFAQRGLDEMQILTSSGLEGKWERHPRSPVWPGNRIYSRPGGRVLSYEGELYRFAQDGVLTYGNNLRAMKILKLNPQEFLEHEIADSPILKASKQGWNAMGMHHLDAVPLADGSWQGVVDGVTFTG